MNNLPESIPDMWFQIVSFQKPIFKMKNITFSESERTCNDFNASRVARRYHVLILYSISTL